MIGIVILLLLLLVVYIASVMLSAIWLSEKGCVGTALEKIVCLTPLLNTYIAYLSVFKSPNRWSRGINLKKILEV